LAIAILNAEHIEKSLICWCGERKDAQPQQLPQGYSVDIEFKETENNSLNLILAETSLASSRYVAIMVISNLNHIHAYLIILFLMSVAVMQKNLHVC
jgi:hypothetical protein